MAERAKIWDKLVSRDPNDKLEVGQIEGDRAMQWVRKNRQYFEEASRERDFYDLVSHYRVAIFGSARTKKGDPEFEFISDLSKALVEARPIDIVTGGGPGMMEAGNEGLVRAQEEAIQNGRSFKPKNIGICVELDFEDQGNQHLHIETKHEHFSTRLHSFAQIKGMYSGEGGYGTLLETLFFLQLKQVGHVEPSFPIVVHPIWRQALEAAYEDLYRARHLEGKTTFVSERDLELVKISSNIPEIVDIFSESYDFWKDNIRSKVEFVCLPN